MPNNDLISRKALLKRFEELKENPNNRLIDIVFLDGAKSVIDAAPAVDAKRVIRGEWVEKPYLFGTTKYCSRCGVNYGMPHGVFNYCPNCGAKMDKEKI